MEIEMCTYDVEIAICIYNTETEIYIGIDTDMYIDIPYMYIVYVHIYDTAFLAHAGPFP